MRDGQHDFDFELGSWKIHLKRLQHPLTGSNSWIEFDGTSVTYAHGPARSTKITWPGPNGMTNVRLVFNPPPSGGTGVLSETGPWAMFRLFGRGTLQQAGSPERYLLSFSLGDRSATFEIRAGSVMNPFAPGVLQDFRCPSVSG